MPGSQHGPSIKNPRVYEALRKRRGMSKQRAAAISNAMVSKASDTAPLAIPPTGPHALFNQPGVGIRSARRRKRLKGWDAKVGQTIIGNLVRGEGGRFSGGSGSSASRKPSARSDRAKQRQARADERRARYAAEDEKEQATRADEDAYIAAGATGRERQRRRAEIAAKRRERANVRRARRAEDAAMEREQRGEEDAADEQAKNEAKPKGGGGGGGKAKPTEEEKRAESDRKKAENRAKTAPQTGLSGAEAEFLAGAASGTLPPGSFDTSKLRSLGLVVDTGDTTEATDAGRRALTALERGDVRAALAAIQDGKAQVARDAAKRERDQPKKQLPSTRGGQKPGQGSPGQRVPGQRPASRPPVSTMPVERTDPEAERQRNQTLAQQIIRNLEERRQRQRRQKAIRLKAKAKRERSADEEKAMFAAMSGKGGGGGGGKSGRGGGGGAAGGKAKEPTLWEKNPATGKREQAMGLVHENLFGESYRQRQTEVQARAAERERAREAAEKKTRDQFFALQTGTVQPTAPAPKIKPASHAPAQTSHAGGLSKPERYAELEALTERTRMPQQGWNAQMSDKQRGYLGSLLERARLNTKEGGETRALADDLIKAVKAGTLTKWEASQLIDSMQKPKPFGTLIDAAQKGVRDGNSESSWRSLLSISSFRTSLINAVLRNEAAAEGLPF